MSIATKIKKDFSGLNLSEEWSFSDESRTKTNSYTHSYHRYPAKFIPQIVKQLVSDYTKTGDTVLDPFGGCGTTLVEAKLLGRDSIGIDINPIAELITEVKTTPIKPVTLSKEVRRVLLALEKYRPPQKNEISSERDQRIAYWFEGSIVHELDYIYKIIKQTRTKKIRNFFLVAFSHNLKNSSRWLMKSIKPTIDKNKIPVPPIKTFSGHLRSMEKKNTAYYRELESRGNLKVPAKIYRRDTTQPLPVKDCSVGLIVTSPPYVTSYEYADLHELSLLWFRNDPSFDGWNEQVRDFPNFKKSFIGTKQKHQNSTEFNSTLAERIVGELSDKKSSLNISVGNYFADMNLAFTSMYKALRKGGHACVVIGNTTLKDVDILNAEVATEQMINIGFEKKDYIKREAASNKAITPWRDKKTGKFTSKSNPNKKMAYQYEYVIIMKKP